MPAGLFTVQERVYTERDSNGFRRLRFHKGQQIRWDDAVAAGLVEQSEIPPEQVQVRLPRDMYETDAEGRRRRAHRAGTVVSAAEAARLGLDLGSGQALVTPDFGEAPSDSRPEPGGGASPIFREATKAPPPRVSRFGPPEPHADADDDTEEPEVEETAAEQPQGTPPVQTTATPKKRIRTTEVPAPAPAG